MEEDKTTTEVETEETKTEKDNLNQNKCVST